MSAWRYEFYLLVLKISHSFAALTREILFQHSKIKFVSPRGHVISSIYNEIITRYNMVATPSLRKTLEIREY